MRFRACHRYAKIAPKKVRPVMDLIRGKAVTDAMQILRRVPRRASSIIDKVLRSAVANADESLQADMDRLTVAAAFVDTGPIAWRWLARSRGMANRIRKRTSHITVIVDDGK